MVALLGSGVPALGQFPNPGDFRTSPSAGFPRSWEAGLTVSPHSVVNLYNGNTVTELLLMSFGSQGPATRFSLCHNAASANSGSSIPSPSGFSLGPGWGISFGGALVDNENGTVKIIEDDGNMWTFTLVSSVYESPTNANMRSCFMGDSNPSGRILPPNWGDCCQYHFLGVSVGGNSNGGAHRAMRHCLGSSFTRPPCGWLLYAPGWLNLGGAWNDNENCSGYDPEDWYP